MGSRTLTLKLLADDKGFVQGVGQAEGKLDGFGGKLAKFGKVAAAGIAIGATAVAAGIGVSVKAFADFDQSLNKSVAIMGDVSDAMRGEMSDAAREVAKTTVYSAAEAAEGYFFLASAGLDAAESIEALPRVAAFAQAGNFDLARATDLLTDAQSALGLASDDAAESLDNMNRVGDVLVKANTIANASVEQFAAALTSKAGNALKTLGKDVEEGTAALAVFADQGIKGEAAGTLLTNTLFGLSDRARESAKDFDRLGVTVFDADGAMRPLHEITRELEGALGDLSIEQQTAELAQMGFTKQSREGILALMGNSDALVEYEEQLREAGGTVDEVADKQLQTFHAQLGLLKDQLMDVAIGVGETLMPYLMVLMEWLGKLAERGAPLAEKALGFLSVAVKVVARWFRDDAMPIIRQLQAFVVDQLVPALRSLADWFQTKVLPAARELWAWFSGTLVPGIVGTLVPILTGLRDGLQTIRDRFAGNSEAAGKLWNGVLKPLVEFIATKVLPVVGTLLGGALKVLGEIIGGVIDAVAWLIDKVEQLVGWFRRVKDSVADALGPLKGFLDTAGKALGAAKSVAGGVGSAVRSVIPGLAAGGIVTAPTLAVVGEGTEAEAVLPLSKLRALLGETGGGGPTVIVQGAIDPEGTARTIERVLRDAQRRTGGRVAA